MQDHRLAYAQQVDPFLTVMLAIIEPFDGEAIPERFDRVMKRNAVVASIGGSLDIVPFEHLVLHYVLIISSEVKSRKSLDVAGEMRGPGGQAWHLTNHEALAIVDFAAHPPAIVIRRI